MKPDDKIEFGWVCDQLAKITPALAAQETATLAGALLLGLESHVHGALSALLPAFVAQQQKRRDAAQARMAEAGPKAWGVLHPRALAMPVADAAAENAWLAQFARLLPCGECRAFLKQYVATNPPDYAHYFAWTVALHNAVNAKLGKPSVTEDEARQRWQSAVVSPQSAA